MMKSKLISLILIIMCTIQSYSCGNNENIVSISASEFDKEIKTDSVSLLDVRTPQEYADGHIDGAININVQSEDFTKIAENELPKDLTVLVYCRSGRRSMVAAEMLTKLGYKIVNLKEGITEWKDEGLPIIKTGTSKSATDK